MLYTSYTPSIINSKQLGFLFGNKLFIHIRLSSYSFIYVFLHNLNYFCHDLDYNNLKSNQINLVISYWFNASLVIFISLTLHGNIS